MQQLKVIWQEGMLLRPQHFQQNDRYHAQQLQIRTRRLGEPAWGFFELTLDRQFFAMGKVVVSQASGILPDGTLFELGADGEPLALDVPANTRDSAVWLALPLTSGQRLESRPVDQDDVIARYLSVDSEIADSHAGFGERGAVTCGRPDFRLLLDSHPRLDAYVRLQVCQLLETAPDGSLELDTAFTPSVIQVRAAEPLLAGLKEVASLLAHRGEVLSQRLRQAGSLGTAEIQATPAGALIKLKLAGLPPGPHAIHVHETGTCEGNFASAGAIYNPLFRVMARLVFGYEATMTAYLTAAEKRLARP